MSKKNTFDKNELINSFGTKDILTAVVGKLSSQILLFSIAIVVVIVSSYFVLGSEALVPTIAILVVFIIGAFGYLFFEQKQKIERGEPETINTLLGNKMQKIIHNEIPAGGDNLKIDLWAEKVTKDANQSRDINVVPVKSGESFKIGDTINIKFKSSKDCYLTLLNIGTSGKLTILYPNSLHKDNFIEAGKLYEIPGNEYGFEYQLSEPAGTEKLKAIVTESKVDLVESQLSPEGKLFKTVSPEAAARDISIIEKKVVEIPRDKWNETYFEFKVS
jgi:hypothetical protein